MQHEWSVTLPGVQCTLDKPLPELRLQPERARWNLYEWYTRQLVKNFFRYNEYALGHCSVLHFKTSQDPLTTAGPFLYISKR